MNDILTNTFYNENNEPIACVVLFEYQSETTKKEYVIYTDNSLADNGEKNIYASEKKLDKEKFVLNDIEDEMDLEIIQALIEKGELLNGEI
jgi:Protein of unknown function (DUF1292).